MAEVNGFRKFATTQYLYALVTEIIHVPTFDKIDPQDTLKRFACFPSFLIRQNLKNMHHVTSHFPKNPKCTILKRNIFVIIRCELSLCATNIFSYILSKERIIQIAQKFQKLRRKCHKICRGNSFKYNAFTPFYI